MTVQHPSQPGVSHTLVPSAVVATATAVASRRLRMAAPSVLHVTTNWDGTPYMASRHVAPTGAIARDAVKLAKAGGALATLHGLFNLVAADRDRVSVVGSVAEIAGGTALMTNVGRVRPRLALAAGTLMASGALANTLTATGFTGKRLAANTVLGAGLGLAATRAFGWSGSWFLGAAAGAAGGLIATGFATERQDTP